MERAKVVIVYTVAAVWVGSFLVLMFGPAHSDKGLLAVNGTVVVVLGGLFAETVRKKNGG